MPPARLIKDEGAPLPETGANTVSATGEYFQALGLALWTYTGLEWNVVCVLRKIWPDYVRKCYRLPQRPMASHIQRDFAWTIRKIRDDALKQNMQETNDAFTACSEKRNDLFHASPVTAPNGDRVLRRLTERSRILWTIEDVAKVTRQFDAASRLADALRRGKLLKKHGSISGWPKNNKTYGG